MYLIRMLFSIALVAYLILTVNTTQALAYSTLRFGSRGNEVRTGACRTAKNKYTPQCWTVERFRKEYLQKNTYGLGTANYMTHFHK